MKKILLMCCAAWMAQAQAPNDLDGMTLDEESDLSRWYVGVAPGWMWMERGAGANSAGYAAVRLGYEYNRTVAFEFGGMFMPEVEGDTWKGRGRAGGVFADALLHLDLYNRWFDPYVMAGLGVYGGSEAIFGSHRTAIAPRFGLGVMSHLTERVSLRFDAVGHCVLNAGADYSVLKYLAEANTDFMLGFELAFVWHF